MLRTKCYSFLNTSSRIYLVPKIKIKKYLKNSKRFTCLKNKSLENGMRDGIIESAKVDILLNPGFTAVFKLFDSLIELVNALSILDVYEQITSKDKRFI